MSGGFSLLDAGLTAPAQVHDILNLESGVRVPALILLAALPASLSGQNRDRDSTRPWRRVSVVLEMGRALSGPGTGLATQLRAAGFDDATPGGCFLFFCGGPSYHPQVTGPSVAVNIVLRVALSRSVAIGAGSGTSLLGGADGFRAAGPNAFGDYIFSDWEAKTQWVAAFWTPNPSMRFGLGPGWYRLSNESQRIRRVGAVGEVGVQTNRRIFMDLSLRYHLIPGGAVEGATGVTMRPKWSHATLTAGVGLHF